MRVGTLPWLVAALIAPGLLGGCGSSSPRHHAAPTTDATHTGETASSGAEDPTLQQVDRPAVEGSLELTLATPTGELLFVGDMRGQPVLLYIFATFDMASQANLSPLNALAEAHPELRVVGVAVQPDARMLLDAWVHALNPSFEAAFDPDDAIAGAETVLGLVTVPTLVLLNADGVPRARLVGVQSRGAMEAMLERL